MNSVKRERLYGFIMDKIFRVSRGQIIPRYARWIYPVLFPIRAIHYWMTGAQGYDYKSDQWTILGTQFSGAFLREIARFNGTISWRHSTDGGVVITTLYPNISVEAFNRLMPERVHQVVDLGYTTEKDVAQYLNGELAAAAACYAYSAAGLQGEGNMIPPPHWPWSDKHWNPQGEEQDLIRAGALILAALDAYREKETK